MDPAGVHESRRDRKVALKALRKNWQFQLVYRQGKKIICKHAIVFLYNHDRLDEEPCFGFVASKRVGSAVKRNRAKRLLREAFRQISKDLERHGFWMVIVAKANICAATAQETLIDLKEKLTQTGLIRNNEQKIL